MTPRHLLNRTLLALIGVIPLGGGLLIIAAGLDLYRRRDLAPPAGWPLTTPDAILLSSADRTRWSSQGWWWWPAVIAALTLITVLALGWLLAQLPRRPHPGTIPLGDSPEQQTVELRSRALSDAIASEAGALPGVQQAHVRITGRPTRPHADISLTLTPQARPVTVLRSLREGPLHTAHQSTGAPHIPTHAHLHVPRHKPHRTQ
ncbi:Asp23/Gls24 family envelope stress response protein [Streptomyces sp. NPDC001222]|uniref:alkaline shock response membrane anchor protein AmaP n=1 Tax=Streptomyces sp. NPDC001222 TaxID=3364548 RepID=UPI0036922121